MMSSKDDARLSTNWAVRSEKSKSKLPPCDADTVRVVKILLLDGTDVPRYVSFVLWIDDGTEHQRRFCHDDLAQRYALQLSCRLEIDALKRDLARAKPPFSETSPVVTDAVWEEAA